MRFRAMLLTATCVAVLGAVLQHVQAQSPWTPPRGTPVPPFGITQAAGVHTHYVDNTHPAATDSSNPNGTPTRPRRTLPITLAAGAVVEVHGGPYIITTSGDTVMASGTASSPVFIRGVGRPLFKSQSNSDGRQLRVNGAYYIVEGIVVGDSALSFEFRGHHGVLRNSEIREHDPDWNSAAVYGQGNNFVVFNNSIHDNGDAASSVERDIHGVKFSAGASHVWVLDNQIRRNSGDDLQLGDDVSPEPWVHHVYVGRNIGQGSRENCLDVKQARDVILSQNDCSGSRPTSSSSGEAVVVHNNAERIWVIFNHIHDSEVGVVSAQNGGGPVYVVGNLITRIHHTGGWDPTNGWHLGGGVLAWDTNPLYVVDNTIVDVDYGISINAAWATHLHGNLVSGVTTAISQVHVGSGASNADMNSGLFDPATRVSWGQENPASFLTLAQLQAQGECANCRQGSALLDATYAPGPGSPAADASTRHAVYSIFQSTYGLSIDYGFDGSPRPVGPAWDIGGRERGTTPSPSPTPTPVPSPSPTPTPVPSPSPTPVPSPSPSPSPTPTPPPPPPGGGLGTAATVNSDPLTWSNQPGAQTELAGSSARRIRIDLTGATQVRLSVRTTRAGSPAAFLSVQYSLDENTWVGLGAGAPISGVSTTASAWQTVPAAARRDVTVRVVGQGGDGVADPIIGSVVLEVR